MLQGSDPVSIAKRWFEAFNKHDLELLLALYHDHAQHYSPKLKLRHPESGGLIKGKDMLRTWWKGSFDRLPSLRYEPIRFIANTDCVFMEYMRHVEGEEPLLVGEVLETERGMISASRVYHG